MNKKVIAAVLFIQSSLFGAHNESMRRYCAELNKATTNAHEVHKHVCNFMAKNGAIPFTVQVRFNEDGDVITKIIKTPSPSPSPRLSPQTSPMPSPSPSPKNWE